MRALPPDLSITVIAIIAGCFIVLGIFHPFISSRLGFEEGTSGHRLLSVLIGLMLFALLLIYRLARQSLVTA